MLAELPKLVANKLLRIICFRKNINKFGGKFGKFASLDIY